MAKEKADKMLIAECRVKITKLLDVQNVIDITTIYNECKIEIDELLRWHVNTKIVNDIVNSINRYTMYNVKFQNKSYLNHGLSVLISNIVISKIYWMSTTKLYYIY